MQIRINNRQVNLAAYSDAYFFPKGSKSRHDNAPSKEARLEIYYPAAEGEKVHWTQFEGKEAERVWEVMGEGAVWAWEKE